MRVALAADGTVAAALAHDEGLSADEVSDLYSTDAVPSDGLVAEFLLNADTGTVATDTVQGNNGNIFGAAWEVQR